MVTLAAISISARRVYATVEFVDIAGLVAGASRGEGLGNQFLSHIREVDAIVHVVRAFSDTDVIHVHGKTDPLEDLGVIMVELALADLATVEKRLDKVTRERKAGDTHKLEHEVEILARFKDFLQKGEPLARCAVEQEDSVYAKHLSLLTAKPFFVALNTDENTDGSAIANAITENFGCPVVPISAKIEAELAEISDEEASVFMRELGMNEKGLDKIIRTGYGLLGLITYFTTGEPETRAWTIVRGAAAPQAAAVIHTDFERLFIAAEVTTYHDFVAHKGWSGVREVGKMRLEGREYIVQDSDVCFFRIGK